MACSIVSSSQPTVATAPFNKPFADIILRSSDNIDFHVSKAILSVASSVFEAMLDLPQPTTPSGDDVDHNTPLPIVSVTEDSRTLDHLLRICYPIVYAVPQDLKVIGLVLQAAIKYEMEVAVHQMTHDLRAFAPKEPIRVYIIACNFRLEGEAAAAAKETLRWPEIEHIPQMDDMSAGALHRLLEYRRQLHSDSPFEFCEPHPMSSTVRPIPDDAIFNFASGDVILQSSDDVQYRVHSFILSNVSTVFARDLASVADSNSSGEETNAHVVVLPEDGLTIFNLLGFCYSMADPDIASLDVLQALLAAAVKYKLARAMAFARKEFLERTEQHPLQAYFFAMRHLLGQRARETGTSGDAAVDKGLAHDTAEVWRTTAKAAADLAIYADRDIYTPDMEMVSANVYRQFLDYRAACEEAISTALSSSQFAAYPFRPRPHWSDGSCFTETAGSSSQVWAWLRRPPTVPSQLGEEVLTPVIEKALQETNNPYNGNFYYNGGFHNSSWDVTRIIKDSKELGTVLRTALNKVPFE